MTRRERAILVVTIIVIVGAVFYHYGLESGLGNLSENRRLLQEEKKRYEGFLQALKRRPLIEARKAKLERLVNPETSSDVEFTPMIEREFKSIQMKPNIRTPSYEFLYDGAKDYGRVTLRIGCNGDVQKVGRMMILFDERLIEVNSLSLTTRVDSPVIEVDATVSQIVKLTDDMKTKLKAQEKPARRAPTVRPHRTGRI